MLERIDARRSRRSTRSASSPATKPCERRARASALAARRAGRPARRRPDVDQGPDPHQAAGRRCAAAAPSTPTSRGTSTRRPRARLREAGAVLLGKTRRRSSAARARPTRRSPASRATRGTRRKTPGGSSGGTAAAVAAGLGPLGSRHRRRRQSVRIPAAFCGNFGLKPSFGRVPAYPLSPFGTVSHLGPHTMSVRRRGADDERAEAARCARLDLAAARRRATTSSASTTASPACASRTRRRSATRTSHPEVAAAGRRARSTTCDALGAHRRGGRPRLRRPAGDHHRAVVRGRVDAVEHAHARAAGGHRSRLRGRGRARLAGSARSTCSA